MACDDSFTTQHSWLSVLTLSPTKPLFCWLAHHNFFFLQTLLTGRHGFQSSWAWHISHRSNTWRLALCLFVCLPGIEAMFLWRISDLAIVNLYSRIKMLHFALFSYFAQIVPDSPRVSRMITKSSNSAHAFFRKQFTLNDLLYVLKEQRVSMVHDRWSLVISTIEEIVETVD